MWTNKCGLVVLVIAKLPVIGAKTLSCFRCNVIIFNLPCNRIIFADIMKRRLHGAMLTLLSTSICLIRWSMHTRDHQLAIASEKRRYNQTMRVRKNLYMLHSSSSWYKSMTTAGCCIHQTMGKFSGKLSAILSFPPFVLWTCISCD